MRRPLQAVLGTLMACLLALPALKGWARPDAEPLITAHPGKPPAHRTLSRIAPSHEADHSVAIRSIPNGVLWVTGAVTQFNRSVVPAPTSAPARAFWQRNREPDNATVRSLGHLPAAVVACEYFSVSFAVWVLDCLPRLASAAPFIKSQGLPYLLPGEPFALQYAVEVLQLPE
eukprot:EG_transcript_33226